MAVSSEHILQFIRPAAQGDEVAMQQVFPHIYHELYAIARSIRFNFHGIDTMNTTAIIHEEYLKISSNFQKKILPYTDKDVLISSILYYESTMKSFHEYNDL